MFLFQSQDSVLRLIKKKKRNRIFLMEIWPRVYTLRDGNLGVRETQQNNICYQLQWKVVHLRNNRRRYIGT